MTSLLLCMTTGSTKDSEWLVLQILDYYILLDKNLLHSFKPIVLIFGSVTLYCQSRTKEGLELCNCHSERRLKRFPIVLKTFSMCLQQQRLIPQVKTEKRDGSSTNDPYVAFRRRTEKMQTRKV